MDEMQYIATLPGLICIKDLDWKVTAISRSCAQLCGWKEAEDAIGYTDHAMPSASAQFADEFIKLDKLCVSSQKKLNNLQIVYYQSEWKIILSDRSLIFNKNGDISRLHISAMDITNVNLLKGILLSNNIDGKYCITNKKPINYVIDFNHQLPTLTEKQELCLFFLLRGKTMKQIANILKISIKTVEDHLDAIKRKLNCHSKSQLIEKSIDSGFFYCLPKVLFKDINYLT